MNDLWLISRPARAAPMYCHISIVLSDPIMTTDPAA
jgi:hypothetical protein